MTRWHNELRSAGQEEHIVSINSALSLYTDDLSPGITLGGCLQQCHVSYAQLRQIMVLVPAKQATRNISEHPLLLQCWSLHLWWTSGSL